MRGAIVAVGVLSAVPAAAADDEAIDEVVTTARYIASTIGKSPAPLIETPFTIDVTDREVIDLRNVESVAEAPGGRALRQHAARGLVSVVSKRPSDDAATLFGFSIGNNDSRELSVDNGT